MDTDQNIERAASRLAETAGSPVRVILFGSHARDDARPGSDLDFLVIEPHVSDRHAEMVRLRSALHDRHREHSHDVDYLCGLIEDNGLDSPTT